LPTAGFPLGGGGASGAPVSLRDDEDDEEDELPRDELDEALSSNGSAGSGMFACFGGWFAPEQATNNARDAT
jgi:hypothetical protein